MSSKTFVGKATTANYSYNSLIIGYIKRGQAKQALTLYQNLEDSLNLSECAFVALLKACAATKDVKTGTNLHARLLSSKSNCFVSTALIYMYAKCGMLGKAHEIFDQITDRDVVCWNALITGYLHHDRGEEVLECFEQMQLQGVSPDVITYASVLKSCGIAEAKNKGEEIHVEVEKRGLLRKNVMLGNTLIDMYAKCGSLTRAKEVFDVLANRTVVSWTALITGYAQHERGQDALDCFGQMECNCVTPDAVTYACILKACGSMGDTEKGIEIHADIERRTLLKNDILVANALVDMYAKCGLLVKAQEVFDMLPERDVVTWTSLLAGYCQRDHGQEALNCFKQMQQNNVLPNAVTYACVLKACGSVGALEEGREIHSDIQKGRLLETSQLAANALIDMYAKCGMLAKAQEIFDEIPNHDVISWTLLITGYAQVGEMTNVICLLNRMTKEGIKPNPITFLSVLNACSHSGLVDVGYKYFETMSKEYYIASKLEHYTCIIDLLGRAGQIDRAIVVMKRTPSYPNIVLWLTILGACRKWGDLELGRHAFEEALRFDEEETAVYVSMYNIYADQGMHAEAKQVDEMRLKKARMTNSIMNFVD